METTTEEVWVKASTARPVEYYHTDEDCFHLQNAKSYARKQISVLPADIEECSNCADGVSQTGGPHAHYQNLVEASEENRADTSPNTK